MTTKPFFSIITVTLNNISGLKRTYNSIKNQTCDDYEWIIIDGASNDGTQSYLTEQGITYISEKDSGIYDAMNKGIDRATGQYLIFMNAGDCLAKNQTLEMLKNTLSPDLPDFAYGDALEDGKVKKARHHNKINHGMITHHQAMIYHRTFIDDLRYNLDYTIAADYDFTLKFIRRGNNILYISNPICIFETGGISQQNVWQGRKEQFLIRRANGIPMIKNIFYFAAQTLLYMMRKIVPRLYWFLKRH